MLLWMKQETTLPKDRKKKPNKRVKIQSDLGALKRGSDRVFFFYFIDHVLEMNYIRVHSNQI